MLRFSPDLQILGRILRAYRTGAGLTQERLASRTGMARNYIGKVERGEANISFLNLERWLAAVGVSWERFGWELSHPEGGWSRGTDTGGEA